MKAPTELKGASLAAWRRYVKELAELGPVNQLDRAGLITLCRATALKESAALNLEKTGAVIKLPNSYPGPSPYLKIFLEASKLEKSWLIQFGLTRASRSKVKAPEMPTDEELDI